MLRSLPIGLAAAALLLGVLGLARMLVVRVDAPDLLVREVETVSIQEPPPPPPPDEPPPDTPPPPPALMEVSQVPDPSRVPIPKAEVPMDITLPVETFFSDLPPAPLPEPSVVRRTPSPVAPARSNPRPAPRPTPPPVAKSHYNVSELDGSPRLLRHGSATFPPDLARKGISQGTVVLEVELSTGGSVSVRRVVSSTHPELVSAARRVAAASRFTPPTRRGQPVRAIMRWPITIKK
jgi:protein TonB